MMDNKNIAEFKKGFKLEWVAEESCLDWNIIEDKIDELISLCNQEHEKEIKGLKVQADVNRALTDAHEVRKDERQRIASELTKKCWCRRHPKKIYCNECNELRRICKVE